MSTPSLWAPCYFWLSMCGRLPGTLVDLITIFAYAHWLDLCNKYSRAEFFAPVSQVVSDSSYPARYKKNSSDATQRVKHHLHAWKCASHGKSGGTILLSPEEVQKRTPNYKAITNQIISGFCIAFWALIPNIGPLPPACGVD